MRTAAENYPSPDGYDVYTPDDRPPTGIEVATQSPEWDGNISLDEMLAQGKFFVLRRGAQTLVHIVHEQKTANGFKVYHNYGLSHDRFGVTYDSDGSIRSDYIAELLASSMAVLTQDKEAALRYIWEVMNCAPYTAFTV